MIKKKKVVAQGNRSILRSPELLLMVLPSLIILFLFRYLPISNVVIAFEDYNIFAGPFKSEWVGLENFKALFQSKDFYKILWNTFIISGLKILVGFPFPIILALLMNEIRNIPFKRVSQNIYYLPYFLSWAVIAGLCFDIFSLNGIVNNVIKFFGGTATSFLMSPKYFRALLVITDIWKNAGWGSIVYLSALTALSPELYEAAKVDGAGKIQRIIHITLPGLMPTIIVMFIVRLSTVLDAGQDQILMLYNAMVMDVADIIDTYVYRVGIGSMKYDFSTAVGLFKSLVAAAFVLTANKLAKKRGGGIW